MVNTQAISKSKFAKLCGVSPAAVTKASSGKLKGAMVGRKVDPHHPDAVKYAQDQASKTTKKSPGGIDVCYEMAVEYARRDPEWNTNRIQNQFKLSWRRAKAISDMIKATGADKGPPPPPNWHPPSPPPTIRGNTKAARNKKGVTTDDADFELPDNVQEFADWPLRKIIEKFGTDVRFVDYLKARKEIVNIHTAEIKNAKASGELVNIELVQIGIVDPINKMLQQVRTDGARTMSRRIPDMIKAEISEPDLEEFIVKTISSFIAPMKLSIERTLADVESTTNRD